MLACTVYWIYRLNQEFAVFASTALRQKLSMHDDMATAQAVHVWRTIIPRAARVSSKSL